MAGQTIGNEETPVPETQNMNDRDFLTDLLSTEKHLTSSYAIALHEASNEYLYEDIKNIFDETEEAQRELYDLMFQKGWYQLEAADCEKLQEAYQKFSGFTSQFPEDGGENVLTN